MKTIHQEVQLSAPPTIVYEALTLSAKHAAFTGAAATIGADEGDDFRCYDGQIEGRNIELVSPRRIVQAWRVANWEPGLYTLVRIELHEEDGGTRLQLDQFGAPDELCVHLDEGWHARYWTPLRAYLA